ncbi:MAG: dihydrofolate reductase [Oscillospiraceae bacterium]|nr:dihydrofolate reductase [Oscillospiraceae bacterium]
MNIIAAADKAWGIGKGGDLIYSIPEDMKFFRETTSGKTVIMGRATLESLPGGKPLPKRRNIILSRTLGEIPGAEVCKTPKEAATLVSDTPGADVFVIGGESVYRDMLPFCDTAYITKIDAESEADRHISDFDAMPDWEEVYSSPEKEHEGLRFRFVTYKRK